MKQKKKNSSDEVQIGFTAGQEDVDAIRRVADSICASENAAVKFCLRGAASCLARSTSGMQSIALSVNVATNPVNKHFRLREIDREHIREISKKYGFETDRDAIRFAIRFQSKRI